ncbi:MAG: DNA primase [Deltaproteobacteria bacterium]|nr:DNA primase [Deltaproteobacteria bacterium]
MKFSPEFILEVRGRTDILSVVSQYVDLKRSGHNSYKGLCPFHNEKTPSFHINCRDQFFYCFGCNEGGDVIRFMELITGMSFPEVMEELAKKAGMQLPQWHPAQAAESKELQRKKDLLHQVMDRATEYFADRLWSNEGTHVRNYLRKRGVDDEVSRAFNLGYSLNQWDALKKTFLKEGFDERLLLDAGLIKSREQEPGTYDVFRGRLMVPVAATDGRTVAFGGRLVDQAPPEVPKYVNSPLTPIYKKGELLFGLPQANPYMKALGCAYVVEGYFDLIALFARGLKNVVCSMGTAFTQPQANLLRSRVKELFLLFDGDSAGRKAAKQALPMLLNAELDGRVVLLPHEHDPDSFVREQGLDALFMLVEKSMNVFDYTVDYLLSTYPDTLIGQAQAVREIKELLSQVPDSLKGQLLRHKFAQRLGLDEGLFHLARPKVEAPEPIAPSQDKAEPGPGLDDSAANLLKYAIIYPETQGLLKGLEIYWPEDPTLPLYQEMLKHIEENGEVVPSRLMPRDAQLMNLVSQAATTPRWTDIQNALLGFQEYVWRLKRKGVDAAFSRTIKCILAAETQGDAGRLDELKAQARALSDEKKLLQSQDALHQGRSDKDGMGAG